MKRTKKIITIFSTILLVLTIFASIGLSATASDSRGTARASQPILRNNGVFPSSGNNTTNFCFSAIYVDTDGDNPTNMSIVIDGTWYNMSINWSNGAKNGLYCFYYTKLSSGNHTYYFYTNNTQNETARDPFTGNYKFNVNSGPSPGNKPQLSSIVVSPYNPVVNQTINFTVQYQDIDNDAPTYVSLFLRGPVNKSVFINHSMNVTGTSYSTGVGCYCTLTLGVGNYDYYFSTLANGDLVNEPTSGSYSIYVRNGSSNPSPTLFGGTVSPMNGTANITLFTYSVFYDDGNYYEAVDHFVYIDGVKHTMNNNVSGGNSSKGIYYVYSTYLPIGNHTYWFLFSNGRVNVTLPASGVYTGPFVSTPQMPILMNGVVTPMNGTNKTLFTYDVIYQDGSFGLPVKSFVIIDNIHQTMKPTNTTCKTGVFFSYSTLLSTGNHTYSFLFFDGKINVTLPSTGVYYGPYVGVPGPNKNRPPTASVFANPLTGNLNTTFYFNGTGTDPDGDTLTYDWVFSDGYNISRNQNVIRRFTKYGNYTATLTVTDPGGLWASASAKVTVSASTNPPKKNRAPVIVTNINAINYVKKDTKMTISALRSYDPDNDPLTYKWIISHSIYNVSRIFNIGAFNYTFSLLGNYTFQLTVSDGLASTKGVFIFNCTKTSQNVKPIASASVTIKGMQAMLSGSKSYDPDGSIVSYSWKVQGKNYKGMYYNHTYTTYGYKTVTLTVKDNGGLSDNAILGFYITNRTNNSGGGNKYNRTKIGSHVELVEEIGEVNLEVLNSETGFFVSVIESRENYLKLLVDSKSETGKLIVMDIKNDIIDLRDLTKLGLTLDNEEVEFTDLDKIIQMANGESYYHVIKGETQCQLLVYIPHFSEHVLEIELEDKSNGDTPDGYFDSEVVFWPILLIFTVIIIIIVLIVFQEIRRKKEKEFFYDFRVAEDQKNNGVQTRTPRDDKDDWDDLI